MKDLVAVTLLLAVLSSSNALGQEQWQLARSRDGVVEALFPGQPTAKIEKRSSWAGTIKTHVTAYQTRDAKYIVSCTKLSSMIKRFVSDEKIFDSAKEGVLSDAVGQEISFDKITVDGIPARKLRYEVVEGDDENHTAYHGVAVFIVHNSTTYVANALISKDTGEADLIKFCDSIKVNKQLAAKK